MPDYQKYACQALDNVKNEASTYLTGLARKFVFVGFVDVTRAIFQSDNSIYLVEFIPLLEEMFYQVCQQLLFCLKLMLMFRIACVQLEI